MEKYIYIYIYIYVCVCMCVCVCVYVYVYCRHYFIYANKSTFTVWLAMQIVETYELQETKSCEVIKRKLKNSPINLCHIRV
jgi:hypothetical protein